MSSETKLNNGIAESDFDWWVGADKSDQYTLHVTEIGKQQILNNQSIVEKLAKMFRKLYDGTDCSTTLSLHDVNMMIRHCFDFEGDNLETGELILNLTKHSGGSPNA